jgi:hypothetical protein
MSTLGTHSNRRTDTQIHVKRLKISVEPVWSTFVPVIPRGGMIMDIILYRPYGPGETVTIEIFDDDSNRVRALSGRRFPRFVTRTYE